MERTRTWQQALLAAGQEAGLDHLVDIALRALQRQLDVLREDPDLNEAARASAASNVALVVELAQGTVELRDLETTREAAAFARELARRNVPVAELVRAYRVAQQELWRWAVDELHERVDGDNLAEAIEGISHATLATGDILIGQVMDRYAIERERWVRSADAVRAATVEAILAGDPVDIAAASGRLRYELRQTHVGFVVWAEADDAMPETIAAAVGGPRALLVSMGAGVTAGWSPAVDASAAKGASLAVGSPAAGLSGFRSSHREAMEARRVARLTGRAGTVEYEEVALLALLTADEDQARAFAVRRLGPLTADDESTRRLADTLLAVLREQGSPRRAAKRLGVHENTVAKRLRAIDDLVDLDRHPPHEVLAALLIARARRP